MHSTTTQSTTTEIIVRVREEIGRFIDHAFRGVVRGEYDSARPSGLANKLTVEDVADCFVADCFVEDRSCGVQLSTDLR